MTDFTSMSRPRAADDAAERPGSHPVKRNLVLLRTDSYESHMKARAFADAARRLGFSVRAHPDRNTLAILPASDFRGLEAAWMCRTYGVPGPDPVAVAIARCKSLTYEFLRRKGFDLLPWLVPVRSQDLRRGFDGPVIVKPDSGSGSSSALPWGYRVFDSLPDFRRYLERGKLVERFFAAQAQSAHRHIVMACVDAELYSIACVAGPGGTHLYDSNVMQTLPDSKIMGRVLLGVRHPDTGNIVRMAGSLAAAGLSPSVIYFQCVPRGGRLYPFDLNLRPGTMWEQAAVRLKVAAYDEILAVMLGLKPRPHISWPARYIGLVRVPRPLQAGQFRAACDVPGAVPIIDRVRYDPAKPYDAGHAFAMFAVTCAQPDEFERRAREVIARTRLLPLSGSRSGKGRSAPSSRRAS